MLQPTLLPTTMVCFSLADQSLYLSFSSFSLHCYLYFHPNSIHHQTMRKVNPHLVHWLSIQFLPFPWDLMCSMILRLELLLLSHYQWFLNSTVLTTVYILTLFSTFSSPSFVFKLMEISNFSTCFCFFFVDSSPSGFTLHAYFFLGSDFSIYELFSLSNTISLWLWLYWSNCWASNLHSSCHIALAISSCIHFPNIHYNYIPSSSYQSNIIPSMKLPLNLPDENSIAV